MKKAASFLLPCILSAFIGVFIYHQILGPKQIIIQENTNAAFTKDKTSSYVNEYNTANLPAYAPNFTSAALKSREAVVFIRTLESNSNDFFTEDYSSSTGSGVIVSNNGYIVSNHHVVKNASRIEVTLNDNREYSAKLVGTDPTSDVALLKINGDNLPYLQFANSDDLTIGEWVLAIGNPFRLQSSVTAGIVSAKARRINILESMTGIESFIQTDAAVNPGNSGGALINTNGKLVGINTAIMTYSGRYEGFSFAIPANLVKKIVYDIREYGAVQRGWMGITIVDVDADRAKEAQLDFVKGVYIALVNNESAAEAAGLQKGDIILSVNQKETPATPEFMELVAQHRPGDRINIRYSRNGRINNTSVVLRNHLNTTDFVAVRKDKVLNDLGFELRDLDRSEKSRLKTDGVMVVSIYQNSIIDETNMDPGYIITKVNGQDIASVEDAVEILNANREIRLEGIYENHSGSFLYKFDK